MSRLDGKIAVITGANSGIGLATAKTLLDEGAARVYITGRRKAETPGHYKTGASKEQVSHFFDYAASITPLARTGRDDEVAKVVAFLASDDSSYMTGAKCLSTAGQCRSDTVFCKRIIYKLYTYQLL